jgi:hypothetical protein
LSFLLDTCVLAEGRKPAPDPNVAAWLDGQDTRDLFISAVTLGELFKGASHHPDENRRRKLTAWLEEELQVAFHGRILALDSLAARTWGRIQGEALRQGTPLPILDSMIAAIAQAHGLVVVTRNTRDFSRTGAQIFNPWDEGGLPR